MASQAPPPEPQLHPVIRWLKKLDANTWAQIGLALILAFAPVILGGLFEAEWVRQKVDKFSWFFWALAGLLFVLTLRTRALPARLVLLSLTTLIAASALFLQSYRPWCVTAGIGFTAVEEARRGAELQTRPDTIIDAPRGVALLIRAEQRATIISGAFTGWGSTCAFSQLKPGDGRIIDQQHCQIVYEMGPDELADNLFVAIARPSCTGSAQITQQLRLHPEQ